MERATFGSGCFWCTEAMFQRLRGVSNVKSGYMGGAIKNTSYQEVCSGQTGHAEVIQLDFDPDTITYDELLEVFWKTHDPTTLNRQGNDVGSQYRSVVFYHNENQKTLAESYKKTLNDSNIWDDPIVTEISPLDVFYEAEAAHHDYYNQNSNQPYCAFVVAPKVKKLEKVFADKLS
ncbi:MAG: peptide-methionine (S)-S-oxide reductase MsrA [Ekhidna sp.]